MGALARCSWVTLAHTRSFSYAHSVACAKMKKHTHKRATNQQTDMFMMKTCHDIIEHKLLLINLININQHRNALWSHKSTDTQIYEE